MTEDRRMFARMASNRVAACVVSLPSVSPGSSGLPPALTVGEVVSPPPSASGLSGLSCELLRTFKLSFPPRTESLSAVSVFGAPPRDAAAASKLRLIRAPVSARVGVDRCGMPPFGLYADESAPDSD